MTKKTFALIVLSCLILMTATGCSLLDKMLSIKDDFKKDTVSQSPEQQLKLEEIIIDTPEVEAPVIISQPGETLNVVLYFTSLDGKNLVAVQKEIPKVEGVARATINALLDGPDFQSGLIPSVPAGTRLLDINVKENGLCIVDFSSDIIANLTGGSLGEELTVYAVTNTLTQFPTIDRVEFRVEGQRMDTLLGFTNLEPSVVANARLVKN